MLVSASNIFPLRCLINFSCEGFTAAENKVVTMPLKGTSFVHFLAGQMMGNRAEFSAEKPMNH